MKREKIILECSVCGSHNYTTVVKEDHQDRFEVKKFCPKCGRHTLHKETR